MRRSPAAALAAAALASVVLTGCGLTTDTIAARIPAGGVTFDDALGLREAVVDAGVECPGDQQLRDTQGGTGSTVLPCDYNLLLAVADGERMTQQLTDNLEAIPGIHYLHGGNWVVASDDRGRLERVQDELGGEIASTAS